MSSAANRHTLSILISNANANSELPNSSRKYEMATGNYFYERNLSLNENINQPSRGEVLCAQPLALIPPNFYVRT